MKKIAIIPIIRKEGEAEYLLELAKKLNSCGAEVTAEKKYAELVCSGEIRFLPEADVYVGAELIIVLGGDGSILRAAEFALKYDLPLLGINLGRLGYMAGLEKNELSLVENLFNDSYSVDKRMTISVDVKKADGGAVHIGDALNDVVVRRENCTHAVDLDLVANERKVRTIRSDGLILATPTGSTAYSMAAGGSVIDPALECICVTPICPISRYACPVVFSGEAVINVSAADDRGTGCKIILDGEDTEFLSKGDVLSVKRSQRYVKMLSVKEEGFFEKLNGKISKYELKN